MAEAQAKKPARFNWEERYPALKYRNYRLWFLGQMTSLFGTWMQSTAQGYLIFQLTHSPEYLGYVSFASGVPTWLFTLYGGVIADRVPRRTLMIITQTTMMVLAFVLSVLAFLNLVQPWHILVLAFLLGVANAFDAPARQAFTLEMVERQDLTNAIALNATMFNSATTIGPAVGGVVYALAGPGWCFFLNGVSFVAVIIALALMRLAPFVKQVQQSSVGRELREGLSFVLKTPAVWTLMLLVGCISLFGASYGTLIPAWSDTILHGNATTNGLMQSARGFGSLIAAFSIASMGRFRMKGKLLTVATFVFPAMLVIFSQVSWLPLTLFVLILLGAAQIPIMNLANALVQTHVPDILRGRVMSIYNLTFLGMMPIGGVWAGVLADHIGERETVLLGAGIVAVVAVGVWLFFPRIREME